MQHLIDQVQLLILFKIKLTIRYGNKSMRNSDRIIQISIPSEEHHERKTNVF